MNTNYQYNQTIFPNEEYALISIIDADWQIEEYSTEIIFREKYPTDDIDYVFCGLLKQFGGTLPKYEFARLLGFSLEDIPEKNIYRDEAEEMVLDNLLKERELFGLIEIEKEEKILNPILTLTDEGRSSLNSKLKYRSWKGKFDFFENYFHSENPQFDFSKHFKLKQASPNQFTIDKGGESCNIKDKNTYQLIDFQLKASIGTFELCTIRSTQKKETKKQKVQYALFQSQEIGNLLLVLQKEEVQEELTSIINAPLNRKSKEKLELQCKFKALLNDDSAIFDGRVVKEYLSLWNKRELIQDSRLKWSDYALWAIFESSFISNDWSFISQKAPLEILKERILQYNNRLNWAILSERLDDDYIYEHIYTEGYQWDFEILSSRDSDFAWLLITEINNYNSKKEPEQQIVANWDFLIITDDLSEDRIKFLLPYKSQLDFIQLSKKQPEFVLACMNEILKINAHSLDNNAHYRANWDWKFISENWKLETIWNNIDVLESNLDWYTFLNRVFSEPQFSEYLLENVSFKQKLLKNKGKIRPTFRLENLIWSESLIELFNEAEILLWKSNTKQEGFECNLSIKWTPLLFQKYAPFITTDKGKNHFSQSIKSWDYVFTALDFEWNWIELSRNKHLNFDFAILNRFKNKLDWAIISKNCDENFILKYLFNFDWDFTILSSEKNESFIQTALSQNNEIAVKGWNWGILSERLDENFILGHLFDFNWDFTILSRKKSEEFIKQALNQDESILEKNWDWKHLTQTLNTDFVIKNLTVVNDKWDWIYLTREKFSKDEIIEHCNKIVEYWDWSYLLTDSFSIKELADDDFFILVSYYLNLVKNEELRKKYQSILTKKMPPEFFIQNNYKNLCYINELVQWDWSYLSQHPRFDFTVDFIQQFSKRWDWSVLSQNTRINADEYYLSYFGKKWDWDYISQYSRFLISRNGKIKIHALKNFQRLIKFDALSLRANIGIDNNLVNDFSKENWDFAVLSSIDTVTPNQTFLRKYAHKNWDWQKLSERKDLKVEIKKDEEGKAISEKFINDLLLEFQNKDWNWQFLSTRKDIRFDFEFIKVFADKNWNYQVLAKNPQTVWTTELIEFFLQNNIQLDWNYISENNQALFSSLDRLESVKQFLNWDKLSNNSKITITEDSLERFKDCWNWMILSVNRGFVLTENLIEKYKNRLFFPLLTKRQDVLSNPAVFIKFKEQDWDWDFLSTEFFADKIAEDVLTVTTLSNKINWSKLSSCRNLHLTEELVLQFEDYWDFSKLYKQQYRFTNEVNELLQPFFDEPKTQFLIKIDEQHSEWKGYVYHFAHLSNAAEIIKQLAIKSRNSANQVSDSAGSVVNRRHTAHDFARFYFRPHTPTQFYNENLGHDEYSEYYRQAVTFGYPKCPIPIFFRVELNEIFNHYLNKCYVSNGNMQTNQAQVFPISPTAIARLDFQNLYSRMDDVFNETKAHFGGDFVDRSIFMSELKKRQNIHKNASQQEFLVKNELVLSDLQTLKIICQTEADKQALINLIGLKNPITNKIIVNTSCDIFHKENSRFDINASEQTLSISTNFNGSGTTIIKTEVENCIREVKGDIYLQKPKITEGGKNLEITFSKPTEYQVWFKDESDRDWLLYSTPYLPKQEKPVINVENSDLQPREILDYIKSVGTDLANTYAQKVRHYVLEQHTLLVMAEFEKHFANVSLPISRNLFRFMLALHDIGKPKAMGLGDKNNQYQYTVEIINNLRKSLPFTSLEIDTMIALVSDDPIGLYLQGNISLETAKSKIIKLANQANLPTLAFFRTLSIYYQSDTGSYTKDAGGLYFLEHLFAYNNGAKVFDSDKQLLKFSPLIELKFNELQKSVENAVASPVY